MMLFGPGTWKCGHADLAQIFEKSKISQGKKKIFQEKNKFFFFFFLCLEHELTFCGVRFFSDALGCGENLYSALSGFS